MSITGDTFEFLLLRLLSMIQVPAHLSVEPELTRRSEELRETERRAWSDPSPLVYDLIYALIRDINRIRQFALGEFHRLQELLEEHLSRVGRDSVCGDAYHGSSSVIVHYFNIVRAALRPDKTDPVLIVDPYGVLTGPIAFQEFQPISGRHP
jgi:hypothetical protein